MCVSFVKRLRPERKFPDADSLKNQLVQDVKLAKTLLANDNMLKLLRI
jgi:FAD synthase